MVKARRVQALIVAAVLLVAGAGISGCGSSSGGGGGGSDKGGKIALLLPETKTTRYEEQDKPNFERRVKELCPNCEVIYSNADQDPGEAAAAGRGRDHQGRQGDRDRARST